MLHGVISPMDGVGPEDIKVKELLVRLGEVNAEEVILAMNPILRGRLRQCIFPVSLSLWASKSRDLQEESPWEESWNLLMNIPGQLERKSRDLNEKAHRY